MKCKKCDCEMQMSRELYTSMPPKRKYICPKCHNIEFVEEAFYGSTLSPYTEMNSCCHNFQVNFVNGEYISVCTRCGKIGDTFSKPVELKVVTFKEEC